MNKWDKRFISLAKEISTWSKDPSTQVAAIAVKDKRVIATGYNGLPKKLTDSKKILEDREKKLANTVHAEMNMIYNAVNHGVSLDGATVYVWGLPVCCDCWKGLVQCNVSRVVMPAVEYGGRWREGCIFAKKRMSAAGINTTEYSIDNFPNL
jgi:dCMP deaminase